MKKKGAYAIIGVILLILILVIISGLIFFWGVDFSENIQSSSEKFFYEEMNCGYSQILSIRSACISDDESLMLLVENLGSYKVRGILIRFHKTDSAYSAIINSDLNPLDIKYFQVFLDQISSNELEKIEISPFILIEEKIVLCSNLFSGAQNFPAC